MGWKGWEVREDGGGIGGLRGGEDGGLGANTRQSVCHAWGQGGEAGRGEVRRGADAWGVVH